MKTDKIKQLAEEYAECRSCWILNGGNSVHIIKRAELHSAIDEMAAILEDDSTRLEKSMQCLASLEHCIDEWNYELGLGEKVGALLDDYYGAGNRPE